MKIASTQLHSKDKSTLLKQYVDVLCYSYVIKTQNSHSKKYEIFLIVFTNAIVNPWTMVIHFPNTATTNATTFTVMCTAHCPMPYKY